METAKNPLAIYIHWPYCQSKCPYCDFNSYAADVHEHQRFRDAYISELDYYSTLLPNRHITSVFFGGGTPSLMEPETVALVLEKISALWSIDENIEITLEANPGSVEAEKFSAFRSAGVNRLSLGVQALDDESLHFLGRGHNVVEALRAIDLAANNFKRFSFDLIYARKDQSLQDWQRELTQALSMAGDHLSLYQLTLEPTTQFYSRAARGEILQAPEPEAAAMYELTQDICAAHGLSAYEISNHARPDGESRHNMTYWHYGDYIGIGPGAHGRYHSGDKTFATDNHRAVEPYLQQTERLGHGQRLSETLDIPTTKIEAIMMGLRLVQGIDAKRWQARFRTKLADDIDGIKRQRLVDEGYLFDEEDLRAAPQGLMRLNAVLDYLLNG